jgi:hypothetical protein
MAEEHIDRVVAYFVKLEEFKSDEEIRDHLLVTPKVKKSSFCF